MTGKGLSAPRSGCAPASNCIEIDTAKRAPFGQKALEFFISLSSFPFRSGRDGLAADVVIAAAVNMLVCMNVRRYRTRSYSALVKQMTFSSSLVQFQFLHRPRSPV